MPCHEKNNIGTMPLTNYNEVSTYGKMIGYVTERRIMPPWKADPGYAHLGNSKALNEKQIQDIKNWLDSGMIKGSNDENQIDKYAAQKKAITKINKPDLIVSMKMPFTQKPDFTERTQAFVIPLALKEEAVVEAIEFVPGNKKIVKSCNISIDTGTQSVQFDSYDLAYGYFAPVGLSFIPYQYIWYQWTADMQGATFYKAPYLKKIPSKSNFILHITYAASTSAQSDSSYVKIKYGKKAAESKYINSSILFNTNTLTNGPFSVDIDEKRTFYSRVTLTSPIEIHSIMPMGQNACYSWEIYALDSLTGARTNILKISRWDAHWRKKYDFITPVRIPATAKIFGVTYYNNSEENSSLIILPPKKITNGEGEREEFFLVQYDVVETEKTIKE